MKTLLNLCLTVLLFGCVAPWSETDPELYRQYKYWEAGVNDWHPARGFDVRVNRFQDGAYYALKLTPHRENVPSLASGYIEAAEQVAFEMMTAQCGAQNFVAQAAPQDAGARTLDRYFYQNADLSVGIRYRCRKEAEKPTYDFLQTEQQKWSKAHRSWDKVNGVQAVVATLPPDVNGLHQLKIRLFGGDANDNRRLARKVMLNVCEGPSFRMVSENAALDLVPTGRPPEIVSNENIRAYGFKCYTQGKK